MVYGVFWRSWYLLFFTSFCVSLAASSGGKDTERAQRLLSYSYSEREENELVQILARNPAEDFRRPIKERLFFYACTHPNPRLLDGRISAARVLIGVLGIRNSASLEGALCDQIERTFEEREIHYRKRINELLGLLRQLEGIRFTTVDRLVLFLRSLNPNQQREAWVIVYILQFLHQASAGSIDIEHRLTPDTLQGQIVREQLSRMTESRHQKPLAEARAWFTRAEDPPFLPNETEKLAREGLSNTDLPALSESVRTLETASNIRLETLVELGAAFDRLNSSSTGDLSERIDKLIARHFVHVMGRLPANNMRHCLTILKLLGRRPPRAQPAIGS